MAAPTYGGGGGARERLRTALVLACGLWGCRPAGVAEVSGCWVGCAASRAAALWRPKLWSAGAAASALTSMDPVLVLRVSCRLRRPQGWGWGSPGAGGWGWGAANALGGGAAGRVLEALGGTGMVMVVLPHCCSTSLPGVAAVCKGSAAEGQPGSVRQLVVARRRRGDQLLPTAMLELQKDAARCVRVVGLEGVLGGGRAALGAQGLPPW